MSQLILPPDALALTIGWLKAQSELAALVGTRVMSKLPPTKTYPLVRVSRIGGNEVHGTAHWVHKPLFQFDCYAAVGAENTAFNVARIVSALLSQRFDGVIVAGSHSAVVSDCQLGGINQGYDQVDRDVPVASLDAQVWLHPAA